MGLQIFPNSWYAGGRADGSYVVTRRSVPFDDGHFDTSEGRVPFCPAGEVLQLTLGPQRRFAGHGHNDKSAWEWVPGEGWKDRGSAIGPRCCIYDAQGNLVVVEKEGTFTGSQGWRYVDDAGKLIASWETYHPNTPMSLARGIERIWEWTEHKGIIVGQGDVGKGSVICRHEGKHYILGEGQCTFTKFDLESNLMSLAWVREDENAAVVGIVKLEELRGFPQRQDPPIVVVQPTPPPLPPIITPLPTFPPPHPPLVTPSPPAQIILRPYHYWLRPNVRSNILDLFKEGVDVLGNVGVFQLSVQNVDGNVAGGPNTFETLTAAGVWEKLRAQGIHLAIEMGVIKEWDPTGEKNLVQLQELQAKIAAAGGKLGYVAMDEPLTGAKALKLSLADAARITATFIRAATALGLKVAWEEAWPEIDLETQRRCLVSLDVEYGALPHGWHLDVDHHRQRFTTKDVEAIAAIVKDYAIPTAVILAGYQHPTDIEYKADVIDWAEQLVGLKLPMAHIIVASWVENGTQPQNFELIDLLNQLTRMFG